jgi:hypothetical protein
MSATKLMPWMPRHPAIGYLFSLLLVALAMVGGCANSSTTQAADPTPDCNLAPDLQQVETVTALPEDHVVPIPELRLILADHLKHEKQLADRSNDKTTFVNANCRGHQDGSGTAGK